jgi:hypothetical protein
METFTSAELAEINHWRNRCREETPKGLLGWFGPRFKGVEFKQWLKFAFSELAERALRHSASGGKFD